MQQLLSLGSNTWDEAVSLLEQIRNFALAPPYGFTAEAADEFTAWPSHARFAYQAVLETPMGDLPMTYTTFTKHVFLCHVVNKYNPRSSYTLGVDDSMYQGLKRGRAKMPRTEVPSARAEGAHVWDGVHVALPLEENRPRGPTGMPRMINESTIMWCS